MVYRVIAALCIIGCTLSATSVDAASLSKKKFVKPMRASSKSIVQDLPNGSRYERKTIKTSAGDILIDLITVDRTRPGIHIITDTANTLDCKVDCPVKSLKDFAQAHHAFAAIHGSYFCAADYKDCVAKKNYTFYPFYNTDQHFLTNTVELKWIKASLIAFDSSNNYYFFPDAREFGRSQQIFESRYHVALHGLVSNAPGVLYHGKSIIDVKIAEMSQPPKTTNGLVGGIGFNGNVIYLVVAHNTVVSRLATIMQAVGVQDALNLDGGGSAALWWNGSYKVGPGRNLPNAILIVDDARQ